MEYTVRHDESACRFETTVEGHTGYVEYVLLPDGAIDIRHTIVPRAIEGRGVAAALMKQTLEYVRAKGWKAIPSCSYARAYILRHPEYADLQRA